MKWRAPLAILVCGVAAHVAVAACCILWSRDGKWVVTETPPRQLALVSGESGTDSNSAEEPDGPSIGSRRGCERSFGRESVLEESHFRVVWRRMKIAECGNPDRDEEPGVSRFTMSVGFPLASFRAVRVSDGDGPGRLAGATWYTPSRSRLGIVEAREFPVTPYWPGFAGNSLIYAALLGGAYFGARGLRSGLRRSRGLCFGCGYALTGLLKCPECGTEVPR